LRCLLKTTEIIESRVNRMQKRLQATSLLPDSAKGVYSTPSEKVWRRRAPCPSTNPTLSLGVSDLTALHLQNCQHNERPTMYSEFLLCRKVPFPPRQDVQVKYNKISSRMISIRAGGRRCYIHTCTRAYGTVRHYILGLAYRQVAGYSCDYLAAFSHAGPSAWNAFVRHQTIAFRRQL